MTRTPISQHVHPFYVVRHPVWYPEDWKEAMKDLATFFSSYVLQNELDSVENILCVRADKWGEEVESSAVEVRMAPHYPLLVQFVLNVPDNRDFQSPEPVLLLHFCVMQYRPLENFV